MWHKHFAQHGTDLAATPAMAVPVAMIMTVASAVVVFVVCGGLMAVVGHVRRSFARAGVGAALVLSRCRVASSAASR